MHGRTWPSKAELRTEVFEYIEVFFKRRRRRSTLGMLSPADYEDRTLASAGDQSRRFAARGHKQDQVHCTNPECDRLDQRVSTEAGDSTSADR